MNFPQATYAFCEPLISWIGQLVWIHLSRSKFESDVCDMKKRALSAPPVTSRYVPCWSEFKKLLKCQFPSSTLILNAFLKLPFIQCTAVTILVWMSSGTDVLVGECWLVGSISITWTNLSRPPVAKKFCFQLKQSTSALCTCIREWNFQSSVISAWYNSTLPFSKPSAENESETGSEPEVN